MNSYMYFIKILSEVKLQTIVMNVLKYLHNGIDFDCRLIIDIQ